MYNDCADGQMRDLLPGYVRGTLAATQRARVAVHLESCADCAAEARLIAVASEAFPAPAIDVAKILRALPAAPRGLASARPRTTFAGRAWRLAAAIGVVAIGACSVVALRDVFSAARRNAGGAQSTGANPTIAAGTRTATATDSPALAGKLASLERPRAASISFGGGLSDLTADQLDILLGEIDTLDALPSTEPETHLTPIMPDTDGGSHAR